MLLEDAGQLHEAVIQLLPQEEQEKQDAWFSSVLKYNNSFMENVKKWLSDANRQTNQTVAQLGTDNVTLTQSNLPHVKPFDPQTNENESCVAKHSENGVTAVVTDDVTPSDSVSNVASGTSKKKSSAGGKSNVSTTSSARIKAEADMAALIARQKLLKDKHALEKQEEQLRKRKKQLDLDMEIAATMA